MLRRAVRVMHKRFKRNFESETSSFFAIDWISPHNQIPVSAHTLESYEFLNGGVMECM